MHLHIFDHFIVGGEDLGVEYLLCILILSQPLNKLIGVNRSHAIGMLVRIWTGVLLAERGGVRTCNESAEPVGVMSIRARE